MANDFRRFAVKQIFDSGKDLGESDFQFKTSLHYMDWNVNEGKFCSFSWT